MCAIAEECERLFCKILKAIFLGEREYATQDLLAMSTEISHEGTSLDKWVEVYDYVGNIRFRGFVASSRSAGRSLFIFFEVTIVGKELKPA